MNKSMDQIQQDLFDNSTGPSATNILTKQASANEQGSMTDQADSSGQACLIVAIWDYADPADDLPNNQYAYNALLYNVENAGYDCVVTLTNSQATHEYVWEWLTMLCASYQYVDVYFMGHGVDNYDYILPDFYGFACYDAVNADGTVNEGNEYYPEEMISYCVHPYDYSELRLGVGAFCYSAAFDCDFCFQGISYPPWPDRVWMEINGEGNADQYNIYFMAYWSYYWYVQGWDSNASFNIAASAAAPYYPPYSPFDYFTSDDCPIYFGDSDPIYYGPDPEVTLLVYDESTGSYVDNIPIQIDSSWYSSGSVVDVPAGGLAFQAPDSDSGGAFNCFYDGNNYYGNAADIPLSVGDETITAYYNYIPTYTVTFSATDPSNYPVYTDVYINNNWVGTTDPNNGNLTIALPLGVYPLSDDQYAYDPLYGQAMPLGMSVYPGYPGFVDGNGNLWVVGDTSVWLLYYY